jgi:glycosyltransferase involved in cell wall biosynthesis
VYWLPTPAAGFDVPCIWGPVGGAVSTPGTLWRLLGWRGLLTELVDLAAVRALAALPAVRRASQCDLVFVQNDETRDRLPADVQRRAIVLNHALFTELPAVERQPPTATCLFVGALESRKGPRLALMGLAAAAPDVRLVIVGDGPDRSALEAFAGELGVSSRVRFVGAIPRAEVMRLVTTAAAVVFTGLREEGGIALAEAMLAGTPVIVLAHGGARTIAEATCDPDRVALIEPADLGTTACRIGAAMSQFSLRVARRRDPMLDPEQAKTRFRKEIEQVCFATLSITTTASRS